MKLTDDELEQVAGGMLMKPGLTDNFVPKPR